MKFVAKNKALALAACSLGVFLATGSLAFAQTAPDDDSAGSNSTGDIIVTAQRVEQRLQDVPISITVFDQAKLANNNIVTASDLAAYTPGLAVSTRYGSDFSTFSIRGFSQELRTTPTVATYFADVVAPRGSGVNPGGEGAGPGQLFDLQNVQVLKGPQGTLFGRNTTGGAVLLVPQRPTDMLGGYIEGTLGDYDLRRVQAVLNIPLADTFKVRLGVDRNVRDGYLKNIGLGRKDLGNVNYSAFRLSILAELTPDLENYTVASYMHSDNAGTIPKVGLCFPGSTVTGFPSPTLGSKACQQIDREAPTGFWTVSNTVPDSFSEIEQWQVINTTKWQVSENLIVKNIASYAEFLGASAIDLYGAFLPIGNLTADQVTNRGQVNTFVPLNPDPTSGNVNAQSSFVEEIQLQGTSDNQRFTWQAGLYFESNKPLGTSGVLTSTYTPCIDINSFICTPVTPNVSSGALSFSRFKNSFQSTAAYAQASYEVVEGLKLTGGIRYTRDKAESELQLANIAISAPGVITANCSNAQAPGFGTPFTVADLYSNCQQRISNKSGRPTWLLGVDFKPIDDVLLYAKYTRGYRQGGVAPASPDGLQLYAPEKVDTFELGAKAKWRGPVPGNFSISAFHNNFSNQQIPLGLLALDPRLTSTTAIVNVGKSRLYGFETDLSLQPFQGLRLDVAYSYLNTKLLEVSAFTVPTGFLGFPPSKGQTLPGSIPHKITASAAYVLPLPESIGQVTIGGTFVYQSKQILSTQPFGRLPGYKWGNASINWEGILGQPIDASLFVTNVTNEKMYTGANDQSSARAGGYVSYTLAEPRMWGLRLRYRFEQ